MIIERGVLRGDCCCSNTCIELIAVAVAADDFDMVSSSDLFIFLRACIRLVGP